MRAKRPVMRVRPSVSVFQLAVWITLSLTLPAVAHAGKSETKISAKGLTLIEVRLTSRDVRLMAWKGDFVTVSWKDGKKVPIDRDGSVLRVGSESWTGKSWGSDILVLLPAEVRVDVEVANGDIEVQGFTSRVRVETLNGDVRVAACSAAVDAKTVSGKIHVQDIKGDIVLRTVSGSITGRKLKSTIIETKSVAGSQTLKETQTRQLRMKSHSGKLRFDGRVATEGKFEGSTFSGNLDFLLDPRDAVDLTAKSRFGRVTTGGGIAVVKRGNNYVRGNVKKGGTPLSLSSFSGNIQVRVAGGDQ